MTQEAREEWLAVAWGTLQHLPADLLAIGCQKARETADHPAKIVPIITAETRDKLERRRDIAREDWSPVRLPPPPADICTPEQAAEIMQEFGLRRNPLDMAREAEIR